jgi:hypothetical protein
LPLTIESYELERLEQPVTRGFTRVTTVVHLHGDGVEGVGEDVTWYTEHHDREQAAGPVLPLAGDWTLTSFSDVLEMPDPHRRWAYESAALDLALRQAQSSLAELVGREPKPVAFVISPGLGDPPTSRVVRRWLELEPSHRFKLDPAGDWSDELITELAGTNAIVTADYKAYYRPEDGPPPDPELYHRVAEGFPQAYLEDPALTDETDLVLEPHRDRVTWDAPIHSIADVEALPFRRACSTRSPRASAGCTSCSRSTSTATPTASRSTAVACSSSARDAGRCSTSPRSSIPTARTTSLRASTTRRSRARGSRRARSSPRPKRSGFAGARPPLLFD